MRLHDLTRETLTELYVQHEMTTREIGVLVGASSSTISLRLKKFGIPAKPRAPRSAKGANNGNWRGGSRLTSQKYKLVHVPEHPNAQADGYVLEHIMVALREAERERLAENECVHHINFDKLDNRPENLHICTRAQHTRYHAELERLTAALLAHGIVEFDPERGYALKVS